MRFLDWFRVQVDPQKIPQTSIKMLDHSGTWLNTKIFNEILKKHDSLNPICRYGNWLQPTAIGILAPRLDQAERYSFHREIIFKENIQMPGMRFTERRDVIGGCAKSMRGCDVYSFKTNTDRGVYLIRTMHTQYGGVKVKTTKCRGLSLPASSFPRHMKFSSKTVLKQPGTNC